MAPLSCWFRINLQLVYLEYPNPGYCNTYYAASHPKGRIYCQNCTWLFGDVLGCLLISRQEIRCSFEPHNSKLPGMQAADTVWFFMGGWDKQKCLSWKLLFAEQTKLKGKCLPHLAFYSAVVLAFDQKCWLSECAATALFCTGCGATWGVFILAMLVYLLFFTLLLISIGGTF